MGINECDTLTLNFTETVLLPEVLFIPARKEKKT
jgi:hypothetical protein